MFGKRESSSKVNAARGAACEKEAGKTSGKGRPTPKRRDQEAARRKDMIPADRKLAKQRARQRRDELWRRQQQAMETGDERYLPLRDKGRIRRLTRDYVDARWSFAEWVLPMMLVMVLTMFGVSIMVRFTSEVVAAWILQSVTLVTYGLLVIAIVESIFVLRKVRRIAEQKYPNEAWPRGSWFYIFSRMVMTRRWRQPRTQVQRGQLPHV